MYWPTSAARVFGVPAPLGDGLLRVRPSRRGNLLATLSASSLGVWDTRPTVLQAAVVRTAESIERWGPSVDVFWAHDSRGLVVLVRSRKRPLTQTSTSHLVLYQLAPTGTPVYESTASSLFPVGGGPGEGDSLMAYELKPLGVAFAMGQCQSILAQPHNLLLTLQHPPAVLSVPYPLPAQLVTPPGSHFPPLPLDGETEEQVECEMWDLTRGREWMQQEGERHACRLTEGRVPVPQEITATLVSGLPVAYSLLMDDGRAFVMYPSQQLEQFRPEFTRKGSSQSKSSTPVAQARPPKPVSKYMGEVLYPLPGVDGLELDGGETTPKATTVAINGRLGYAAVGTSSGIIHILVVPPYPQHPRLSFSLDFKLSANLRVPCGAVTSLAWTSDGAALAAAYEHGWAVWSMSGRLNGWGCASHTDPGSSEAENDPFMNGVRSLFWAPGNLDLFMLADDPHRFFALPFVKSATTGQLSPDNTRYAFLQMDDRVMVYRGADQPDMSVINPESDVWQHIHIPNVYIAANWPIRYASISSDGRFIAVAGRRGLTHYSAASGRWKLFAQEREERAFTVRGGLLWFHHVLIAAVQVDSKYQIRLYSRDLDLSDTGVLHAQSVPSPVLVMTLLDNSLLVYTADSMLYHFVILPTRDSIRIHLCGSISFSGLINVPSRVRALSWLIPDAQKRLGDPADDLIVATIIFLVDDRLVLLRPRKAGNEQVRYDMQVLADRIESYWTHLHGVGALENSLWGYDGASMRVWLDALTVEATKQTQHGYETVDESINLRLDFYPLSILMDKGIIIGIDYEPSTRALPFALFKIQTATHLFLPKFLRYHLDAGNLAQALALADNYKSLVYFAHSLEVLLHSVLEDTVESQNPDTTSLSLVAAFLDHFPESLDVVVGCARKTELEHWGLLFGVVGSPRELYDRCVAAGALRTAAGYLLVMHTLEEGEDADDTVRLLRLAMDRGETQLCKELLRFLHSTDDTGDALRRAIDQLGIIKVNLALPVS